MKVFSSLELSKSCTEFALKPEAKLLSVAQMYGFSAEIIEADITLEQLFSRSFSGKPIIGDHIQFGFVTLLVRNTLNDRVIAVGIKINTQIKAFKGKILCNL